MAYIEFRPLLNTEGEEEFELCVYSDQEAEEEFGDDELKARVAADPERGESTIRRVEWSDDEVEAFNERLQEYNEMIWNVVLECGLA